MNIKNITALIIYSGFCFAIWIFLKKYVENIHVDFKSIKALIIYSGLCFAIWAFFQRYYVVHMQLDVKELTKNLNVIDEVTKELIIKRFLLFPMVVPFLASIFVFIGYLLCYKEFPRFNLINDYGYTILFSALFLAISYGLYPKIINDNLINAAFITIAILFSMFLFSFIFSIEPHDGNLHPLVSISIKDIKFFYYKDDTRCIIDNISLFKVKYGYKLLGAMIILCGLVIFNTVIPESLPEKNCIDLSVK